MLYGAVSYVFLQGSYYAGKFSVFFQMRSMYAGMIYKNSDIPAHFPVSPESEFLKIQIRISTKNVPTCYFSMWDSEHFCCKVRSWSTRERRPDHHIMQGKTTTTIIFHTTYCTAIRRVNNCFLQLNSFLS